MNVPVKLVVELSDGETGELVLDPKNAGLTFKTFWPDIPEGPKLEKSRRALALLKAEFRKNGIPFDTLHEGGGWGSTEGGLLVDFNRRRR